MAMVYRTFSPKVVRYVPDGGGRDMYVATDSGGAFHVSSHVAGSSSQRSIGSYSPKRARIDAKTLRYYADGSGRDSYVL